VTRSGYEVEWSRTALRALDRLPEKAATACIEFIYGSLAANPRRVGHPLRLELEGKHSARRGDFRIVYEIDEHDERVTIVAIDHRSDVYRRRTYGAATGESRGAASVRNPEGRLTNRLTNSPETGVCETRGGRSAGRNSWSAHYSHLCGRSRIDF
jgi:mRNA-degrading endonuclease RelE of RelBE toxin-antitoxin system